MAHFGPIYCETGHPWLFMAEPVNTVTNIAILLAALFAAAKVSRSRVRFSADFVILIVLLFATAIGSFFWHAFRLPVALLFDALPGLLFLFFFAAFWIRILFGTLAAVLGALLLILVSGGALAFGRAMTAGVNAAPAALFLAPAFCVIALAGILLVAATWRRHGGDMALGGIVMMACAVAAAIFRSIDLLMCRVIPFGTHFLWHILLATAAYLGIALLVRLKTHSRRIFV